MKTKLLVAMAAMAMSFCAWASAQTTLTLQKAGTTVPHAAPVGGAPLTSLEQDPAMSGGDADSGDEEDLGPEPVVNR
ncbi:MAG: hypothetical protein B7X33_04915, partial [Lysobacterales bacterium 13-68-4]